MHDRVDGQRQIEFAGPAGYFALLDVAVLEAPYPIGQCGLTALEADLDVGEAGIGDLGKFFF